MLQNAYVSLGSNLGDRAGYLLLAVRGMFAAGLDVIRLSSIYETQPVEYTNQPTFLNMVAELRGTTLPPPEQMLARMLRIEFALGRIRDVHLGPRTIDLDLLIYRDELRNTEFPGSLIQECICAALYWSHLTSLSRLSNIRF
jgi:2-amino-4-hydroxy-6-hydroxymethyldihydropteridine diphosphokinase